LHAASERATRLQAGDSVIPRIWARRQPMI